MHAELLLHHMTEHVITSYSIHYTKLYESMAIPVLSEQDKLKLGGGEAKPGHPVAVYGAGTGLGVAHLVHTGDAWLSLPGEGGHVDFAANSEEEDAVLQVMRQELGHVSAERLLSGSGLVNLYRSLVLADGRTPETLQPRNNFV